jgi:hypothetical protein
MESTQADFVNGLLCLTLQAMVRVTPRRPAEFDAADALLDLGPMIISRNQSRSGCIGLPRSRGPLRVFRSTRVWEAAKVPLQ